MPLRSEGKLSQALVDNTRAWRLGTVLLGMYGGLQSTPDSFPWRCCRGWNHEPSTTCRHVWSAASVLRHREQTHRSIAYSGSRCECIPRSMQELRHCWVAAGARQSVHLHRGLQRVALHISLSPGCSLCTPLNCIDLRSQNICVPSSFLNMSHLRRNILSQQACQNACHPLYRRLALS